MLQLFLIDGNLSISLHNFKSLIYHSEILIPLNYDAQRFILENRFLPLWNRIIENDPNARDKQGEEIEVRRRFVTTEIFQASREDIPPV